MAIIHKKFVDDRFGFRAILAFHRLLTKRTQLRSQNK